MPEGPEIHRAANKIRKALEGMVIEDVEITVPRFSEAGQDFIGKTVNRVEARGKAMLIHFDNFVMYSHNQLYGRWTVNLKETAAKKWNRSLRVALRAVGVEKDKFTTHGFRHMARTRLNELGYRGDLIEIQLAHTQSNKVRAAYNHAEHLEERKEMMQDWSNYLDKLQNKTTVSPSILQQSLF